MASGSYYLLACADDTNVVPESNETNNCAPASTKVQVGPDLIETGVSSQTLMTGSGATITVSDTVKNQGGGGAAASFTQYYLNTFTLRTAGAVFLSGNRAVPVLAAGGSSQGSASVTIPQNMATGNYYLLACADDTNLVPETNENNNCAAASAQIQVGPDLIESGVSSQTSVTGAGAMITVGDTARNQGGGGAGGSFTQYYLNTFAIKTSNAVLLSGSRAVPALVSGGNSQGSASVTVPQTIATGNYYLLACADDTNLVPETNEYNNCAAASMQVQVGPDLIESGVSSQSTVVSRGGSLVVTDTAINQGGGSAGASFTQYYLNTFAIKTSNAVQLGGNRAVPALAAGGNSQGSTNVTVPQTIATGNYYLLACADDTHVVPETNENNNCKAYTYQIQVQ